MDSMLVKYINSDRMILLAVTMGMECTMITGFVFTKWAEGGRKKCRK